jgi:nitroreductase
MLADLVLKNRSYRRFYQKHSVDLKTLEDLVDLARLSASGGNAQPLKYILSSDPKKNALIFPHLTWAAFLKDWPGPEDGERPSAYIIILGDREISQSFGCDHGVTAQTILLGATEKGLGGCIIGTIQRENLRASLEIPARFDILLVLAIGKPKERVIIERVGVSGDTKYWRDDKGVHHVPKRSIEDIIIG